MDSGDLFKKLGGRKFIMAFGWMLITFIMVFVSDKVSFEQWADWSKWAFGLYVGGNIGEHGASAIKSRNGN